MPSRYKIVVYIPVEQAEAVREAMGAAGGGRIGNYSHCSFSSRGISRYVPGPGANPSIGEIGKKETVEEERIDMICHEDVVGAVIAAMKRVHPYEEIIYDLYQLTDWQE